MPLAPAATLKIGPRVARDRLPLMFDGAALARTVTLPLSVNVPAPALISLPSPDRTPPHVAPRPLVSSGT